jgi:Arc/MetJ-type ribon-helix-helix transcriptional regulator
MNIHLSPENEAFLTAAVARREFTNRDAAIDEAVGLLRRRRALVDAVDAGVGQLNRGEVQRYEPDELERFLADVETRARTGS